MDTPANVPGILSPASPANLGDTAIMAHPEGHFSAITCEADLIDLASFNATQNDALARQFRTFLEKEKIKRPFSLLNKWFASSFDSFTPTTQNFDTLCQWITAAVSQIPDFQPAVFRYGDEQALDIPAVIREIITPHTATPIAGDTTGPLALLQAPFHEWQPMSTTDQPLMGAYMDSRL